MKILMPLLFIILLINLVSANIESLPTQQIDTNVYLKQIGADFSSCNITSVSYPNSSTIILDVTMTKRGTEYNYTLSSDYVSVLGNYVVNGFCTNGSDDIVWVYDFEATVNGDTFKTSQSIIYLPLLFVNLLFLSIFVILSFKIPYGNKKDILRGGQEVITKVSKIKYIKLFSIWISYFLYLWLITIIAGMVNNYISFNPLKDMAMNLYLFSQVLGYGVSVAMIWFIFLNVWRDIILNKKILKEGKAFLNNLK